MMVMYVETFVSQGNNGVNFMLARNVAETNQVFGNIVSDA
jgi:hypothetical protein